MYVYIYIHIHLCVGVRVYGRVARENVMGSELILMIIR